MESVVVDALLPPLNVIVTPDDTAPVTVLEISGVLQPVTIRNVSIRKYNKI